MLSNEIAIAENKKTRKRVFRMLQSLYTLFACSGPDIQMIDQYMKIWKPKGENGVADVILWPYEGIRKNKRFSRKKVGRCCLYALVTECIKEYHIYHAISMIDPPQKYEGDLDAMLTEIESLIAGNIDFPIKGSEEMGYYLWQRPKRKKKSISGPPRRK